MAWNTDGQMHWDPKWVMEPDVGRIKEAVQPFWGHCGFPNADITVEYLTEGSWNKAYTVSSIDEQTGARHECIFRVALPVVPWYKVQSEVATMEYVRINTTIPVPRVYAFDSSMNNAVGLEWILMEKIQGESYGDAADYMSTGAKLEVKRKIAEWMDQLSKLTFDGIGSLYCQWDRTSPDFGQFKLGPIVYQTFMPAKRAQYEVFHGPYGSLAECYHALLEVQLAEANDPETKFKVEDEPHLESPTVWSSESLDDVHRLGCGLHKAISHIIGQKSLGPNSTYLRHWDISESNVMVGSCDQAAALIDWE
ncbi:uncharacterized protein K441DRAFT_649987, partial [Cenococcum geophilum 1.58]|uniref:uncharacterized protein n=1 Tax=Cenococcum geophilum 1.58 TaxID=794803 RepID=UPI000DC88930